MTVIIVTIMKKNKWVLDEDKKKMPNIPSLTIVKTTLSKMEKGGERL